MKKLNITFCSFPDFSGNAKALYKYMIKRYKDRMNYTWIVYNDSTMKLLNDKGIKSILIGTDEFKKYIPKTNVFFTTHANLAGDKIKTKNSIYVELWHGIGPKPVGFLTENLSKKDKNWYNFLKETIDYMIVPSELWRVLFSTMFNINVQQVLPLGLPLLDEIKKSNGKENLSKLIGVNVNRYNKIIMYMPTFKKGCGRKLESNYNKNNILNFYDYSDNDFIEYLRENKYLLIVKRHPNDECNYVKIENDFIKNINDQMLLKQGLNVNNILNAGDLLITDYSSLGLEFCFLDKPVIYIATDLKEYIKNRGVILKDYDFWTQKNYCYSYKEFIYKLEKNLQNKNKINIKKELYGSLEDGGCDKICDFLFDDNQISSKVKRYKSKIFELEKQNEDYENIINEQISTIKKLTESDIELKQIKNSRSWKILEKLRKLRK
ncbi:MAG TPA: CDP-glycerol glycerophosphotransferase family protein [Candidatus Aphodocola excrementigallinarum]|uniref:CDP-glycerol glycerophosphotransferase family protein n=1 Tax=Candidatus Aphodocola excrementigallinarum TaxID=2840670 RepID=A0A9D1IP89_9FIRM|nr:CDP-glycerol glycerophosphotransferase family protein [Candidatus Aphodocola excrementigallinarum]